MKQAPFLYNLSLPVVCMVLAEAACSATPVVKPHRTVVPDAGVENVWKRRGSAVEVPTPQFFS